jgi:protein-arginine deiminase
VEEVLADGDFHDLNLSDVQTQISTIKANLNAAANNGLTFVSLPCLFFGYRTAFGTCMAFNPGPTDHQPLNGRRYVPMQFAPRTASGVDIFEDTILNTLGPSTTVLVDCWDYHHALVGEIHCASEVKRAFPAGDWWLNLP